MKPTSPWPLVISIVEKKNENYVECDFRIGTVLLSFLFFWTDNAPCVKILISTIEKKINENYVEFDFRMGAVIVWHAQGVSPLDGG